MTQQPPARSPLAMRRTARGRYYATGEAHTYLIIAVRPKRWELIIRPAVTVCQDTKVSHPTAAPIIMDAETKTLVQAIADEFEALGEDYASHQHGHRQRGTEATLRAYCRDA